MFFYLRKYCITGFIVLFPFYLAVGATVRLLIDTASINEENNRAKKLWSSAPDSLIELSQGTLKSSKLLGYQKGIIDALVNLGVGFYEKGDYVSSINNYSKAIETMRSNGIEDELGKVLSNISMPFLALGQHNQAIKYLQEALIEAKRLNLPLTQAHALHNMGMVYHYQGNHTMALRYYKESNELYKKSGDTSKETFILGNIAHIYLASKDYDTATTYYIKSLEQARKSNNFKAIGNTLQSLGNLYQERKLYHKALVYFYEAKAELDRTGEQTEALRLLNNFLICYDAMGVTDSALYYAYETFNKANAQKQLYYVQESSGKLSDLYERKNDYKKALLYGRINKQSSDSLQNSEAKVNMARMEERFKYEKLDQELKDSHKVELEKKRYLILFITIVIIFLLIIIILLGIVANSIKNKKVATKLSLQKIKFQKERLEEADHFKGHLISILAHDVRTPISNIISLLKLCTDGHLSPEKTVEFLVRSYQEMNNLSVFINDLLSWVLRQNEERHTEFEMINISEVMTEIDNLFRRKANDKGISLKFIYSKQSQVFADQDMLKIVLRNLMDNAIKFSSSGDEIYIEAQDKSADKIRFLIKDTGSGFQMSTRGGDESFPERRMGTSAEYSSGLGLALCSQYLKKNNSSLYYYSEPGVGSCFWFKLQKDKFK